jgi:YD repeat-containing protein
LFKDIETTSSNTSTFANRSFYLTQIIASDNSDVIDFTYQQSANGYTQNGIYSILDDAMVPSNSLGNSGRQTNFRYLNSYTSTAPINLIAIESRNIKIQFQYTTDRLDKIKEKLNTITIIDKTSSTAPQTVKKINFAYSYFGSVANNNQRLKLTNVFVSGSTNLEADKYSFNYNNKELPPYPGDDYNAPYFFFHEDYWGYYNGGAGTSSIPIDLIDPFSNDVKYLYSGDRNPSANYMDACMIEEVVYPTGGKTVFEFEPNNAGPSFYPYTNTNNGIVGGLRVKKLKTYTSSGAAPIEKYFEYQLPITPIDNTTFTQAFRDFRIIQYPFCPCTPSQNNACMCWTCLYGEHHISAGTPSYSLTQNSGSPVIYTKVTEYNGTPSSNLGKKEYWYSFSPMEFDDNFTSPRYSTSFHFDRGLASPKINREITFKNNGNSYEKVTESIYQYSSYNVSEFNTGIKIDRTSNDNGSPDSYHCGPNLSYFFSDSKGFQDNSLLTQKSDYVFSGPTASLQNVTTYDYNALNIIPKSKTTLLSDGNILTTFLKYPSDFLAQSPYSSMLQKNIISPIVEQSQYKNGTNFLTSTKTNYNYWSNNGWSSASTDIIVPQTVESKILNNNAETRVRYHAYDDKGNVLSVSKENDSKTSYIWGYNKQYPVAQVTGADYATISGLVNQSVLDNPLSTELQIRNELNNIRTGLANTKALVTTYTYRPLIGISSQTDPNGRTIYYEYDSFNRLSIIRDQDNNIIKKIDYKYQADNQQ